MNKKYPQEIKLEKTWGINKTRIGKVNYGGFFQRV